MNKTEKVWTHTVALALDVAGDDKEATTLKIGDAHLSGSDFVIELAPGLSVSGRIVLKLKEEGRAL
jgi:hypothetical protein